MATSNFNTDEKTNILIKKNFEFPYTSNYKEWYEETAVPFNNYLKGEELLVQIIPQNPDFNNNGLARQASEIGLNPSDFINYTYNPSNLSLCSIVDDSLRIVRRFQFLILQQCPQLGNDNGASWYKLDSSYNNILANSLQFNYNEYISNGITYQPYLYNLYSQIALNNISDTSFNSLTNMPFGPTGGTWNFDHKTGILFFSDFINFSNGIQTNPIFQINLTNNKPVFTFYKYIGSKSIANFTLDVIASKSVYKIFQIVSTNLNNSSRSNLTIQSTNYTIINDLSLSLYAQRINSTYKIYVNFNYLSSNYYDMILGIALCYTINNGTENIIGQYMLGTENTSFKYDLFSTNFFTIINSYIGNLINFYIKANIVTSISSINSINSNNFPQILLSLNGNNISIEELNYT